MRTVWASTSSNHQLSVRLIGAVNRAGVLRVLGPAAKRRLEGAFCVACGIRCRCYAARWCLPRDSRACIASTVRSDSGIRSKRFNVMGSPVSAHQP